MCTGTRHVMTQKTMISLLIPAEQGISARDTFDTDCVAHHRINRFARSFADWR